MNKFRIFKTKEKYITTEKVVNEDIYYIQEFTRSLLGIGKKKWRNIYASSYGDYTSLVYFYTKKEADKYLKELKEYYNE